MEIKKIVISSVQRFDSKSPEFRPFSRSQASLFGLRTWALYDHDGDRVG